MLGASGIRSAIHPPVLWEESGIVSFNLGMPGTRPPMQYYWLKEALKYQSPSVVIINARWAYREHDPLFGDNSESRVRQALDPMRLSTNKISAIIDVINHSESQSFISYIFPILRFGSREVLGKADFDFTVNRQRHEFMGSFDSPVMMYIYHAERRERIAKDYDGPEIVNEYLERMIDLCKERDIEVILVASPAINWNEYTHHYRMRTFAEKRGVVLIDVNTDDLRDAMSWDDLVDFRNPTHANLSGGRKISLYIAEFLTNNYGLPNRRDGSHDPYYDEIANYFNLRYNQFLEEAVVVSSLEDDEEAELDVDIMGE